MVTMHRGTLYDWLKCNICMKYNGILYLLFRFIFVPYALFILYLVVFYNKSTEMVYIYYQLFDIKSVEEFIASFSYFRNPLRVAELTVVILPILFFNIISLLFVLLFKRKYKKRYYDMLSKRYKRRGMRYAHETFFIGAIVIFGSLVFFLYFLLNYSSYDNSDYTNISMYLLLMGFFFSNIPFFVVTLKWDIKTFRHKLRLLRYRRRRSV